MRKLLIGAGAVALLMACSSSESDVPGSVTGAGGDSSAGVSGGAPGTGGATGVGTGGSSLPGTGGSSLPGTGGTTGVGTGGTTVVNTGGTTVVNTGGTTMVNTGGTTVANTGGTTVANTGGTTQTNTGGTTVANTGGTTQTNTGGTDDETGGTSSGDDDDTGTGGTDEPNPVEFTVHGNGFVTQGELEGYAWTNDTDGFGEGFGTIDAGTELCAAGVVETSTDYSNVGMIGWNIAQNQAGDDAETTTLSGSITITYRNAGGTPLRLQIEGSDAYCVDLSGTSGEETETFDLSDLVVACWEGGAQEPAYDGEPIESIQLIAPGDGGDTGVDRDVDMCLLSVEVG